MNRSYSFSSQGSEYNYIYRLQGMGTEYFEADRDRSNKQEDNDWMKSERLTTRTLRYNTSFQFRPDCIR